MQRPMSDPGATRRDHMHHQPQDHETTTPRRVVDLFDAAEARHNGTATKAQIALLKDPAVQIAQANLRQTFQRVGARLLDVPDAFEPSARPLLHRARRIRDRVGMHAVPALYAAHRLRGDVGSSMEARRLLAPPRHVSTRSPRPRGAGRPAIRRTSSASSTSSAGDGSDPDEGSGPSSAALPEQLAHGLRRTHYTFAQLSAEARGEAFA